MYKGFKIGSIFLKELQNEIDIDVYYEKEMQRYNQSKDPTMNAFLATIDSFINEDGSIDASRMQENWFSQVDADIFISHSHQDEIFAVALAKLIREETGLTPFVDSCVWGYANNLLEDIDNRFCCNKHGLDYDLHNAAASHIYTMLTTALDMMIQKTECFFFLNTPNSIQVGQLNNQETESPWLYHELVMSRLLFNRPDREIDETRVFDAKRKLHPFNYLVTTTHLKRLSYTKFCSWLKEAKDPDKYALDVLYEITKEEPVGIFKRKTGQFIRGSDHGKRKG